MCEMCGSYDHTTSLAWNRLFMVQMEDELGEALPYWDWTEDKDLPDLWEEIRAPLKPPLKSECGADEYGNGYGSKGYGDGYGRSKRYSKGYGEGGGKLVGGWEGRGKRGRKRRPTRPKR